MTTSDFLHTSFPSHGGFYLLHPADTRTLLGNVQQLLDQQETFQLWCQRQTALLTHCLRLLIDLEYGFHMNHTEPGFNQEYPWTRDNFQTIAYIRDRIQELLNIMRRYRFDHHRPDHFHRVPSQLYHHLGRQLNYSHLNCCEPPPRTRSTPARHRWRTYPRTALPFDYQMWQRGLHPQFDPDSDSD